MNNNLLLLHQCASCASLRHAVTDIKIKKHLSKWNRNTYVDCPVPIHKKVSHFHVSRFAKFIKSLKFLSHFSSYHSYITSFIKVDFYYFLSGISYLNEIIQFIMKEMLHRNINRIW